MKLINEKGKLVKRGKVIHPAASVGLRAGEWVVSGWASSNSNRSRPVVYLASDGEVRSIVPDKLGWKVEE